MAVKYKEYFAQMIADHADEFARFTKLHELYDKDKTTHQLSFNRDGMVIVDIIHDYEKRLCNTVERGNKAQYSARLAEKFWAEVRAMFPLIDFVGCE